MILPALKRGLNWTKVGLKDNILVLFDILMLSLNWTKVGLKVTSSLTLGVMFSLFELD